MTAVPEAPARPSRKTEVWDTPRHCVWPESCDQQRECRGLCKKHYDRAKRTKTLAKFPKMPNARRRPADRWLTNDGYVMIRLEDNGAGRPEHRVVMERMLGRALVKGETVHHVNGIRHDNREVNLELWFAQPYGQRIDDLLAYVTAHHTDALRAALASSS